MGPIDEKTACAMNDNPRVWVGGLPFVATEAREALGWLLDIAARDHIPVNVRLANAYNVALASRDHEYARLLREKGLNFPDGTSVVWAMRHQTRRLKLRPGRVRGPSLFAAALEQSAASGLRHFFLGSTPRTLELLQQQVIERYPGAVIAGAYSPPFAAIDETYAADCAARVLAARPDIVWLGLGTPKQDILGTSLAEAVGLTTVNVGAAFDYVAGTVREAPGWIQHSGFEWLYRLVAEPRRLWKRYAIGNFQFVRIVGKRWRYDSRETSTFDRARSPEEAATQHTGAPVSDYRVALLSQLPPPKHGSTVMTQVFMQNMATLGFETDLIDRRFSRSVSEVGRFSVRKALVAPALLIRAARVLARNPRCVVIFISSSPLAFLTDIAVINIARISRVPIVLYVHTTGFSRLSSRGALWRKLVESAHNSARHIVLLGGVMRLDLPPAVQEAKISVIPNTPPRRPEMTGVPDNSEILITFLSNLIPTKGALDFVRAASMTRADGAFKFAIAGGTDDPQHHQAILDSISRSPREFHLLGALGEEEKWDLLSRTTIFVFPSQYPLETLGLVNIEAMSMGIPVVAYDHAAVSDVVCNEETGLLVPPGDVTLLARSIDRLISDQALRTRLGANARIRYDKIFSEEAFREAWQGVLTAAGTSKRDRPMS